MSKNTIHEINRTYWNIYADEMIGKSNSLLCSRKISTYINALSKAGFIIE